MASHSEHHAGKPPILIIARSARALAEAAQSRWTPWAVDFFADEDLRAAAYGYHQLAATPNYDFGAALLPAIAACITRGGMMPIVLGAGFEAEPWLVRQVATRGPLAANGHEVMQLLADMPALLRRLAHRGQIQVPETRAEPPSKSHGWLVKESATSGGFHVNWFDGEPVAGVPCGRYYQRYVRGPSMSAVFVAAARRCELVSINRHLGTSVAETRPFHYQGAVTWRRAPPALVDACTDIGAAVAKDMRLCGVFGLDFIWCADGSVQLLDVNLRPPATVDLLDDAGPVFNAHVAACTTGKLLYSSRPRRAECGQLFVYAQAPWTVPSAFPWPDGAADRPHAGAAIARGSPLCSLRASGESCAEVIAGLTRRARELRAQIPDVLLRELTIITLGEDHDGRIRA